MIIIETKLEGEENWKKQGELNIKSLPYPAGHETLAYLCAIILFQECFPNSLANATPETINVPPIKRRGQIRATVEGREIIVMSEQTAIQRYV